MANVCVCGSAQCILNTSALTSVRYPNHDIRFATQKIAELVRSDNLELDLGLSPTRLAVEYKRQRSRWRPATFGKSHYEAGHTSTADHIVHDQQRFCLHFRGCSLHRLLRALIPCGFTLQLAEDLFTHALGRVVQFQNRRSGVKIELFTRGLITAQNQ